MNSHSYSKQCSVELDETYSECGTIGTWVPYANLYITTTGFATVASDVG